MPDALLVFDIYIEVANQDDVAVGTDAFLATAEFTELQVSFHDVYAIFLIEGDTRHLIEANHIVLAD